MDQICQEYSTKRCIYPIELILTGIGFLLHTRRINYRHQDPIRSLLFYNLAKIDGKYLPLNRDYKPIGLTHWNSFVDYKKFPFLEIPENMMDLNVFEDQDHLFLFHDGTYPNTKELKEKYCNKIKSIFSEKCEFFNERFEEIYFSKII